MTLSEFKAWFEGFTESMDGPPLLKQWERIQARVKEISGAPMTQTVFVDRYPYVKPYWVDSHRYYGTPYCAQGQLGINQSAQLQAYSSAANTMSADNVARQVGQNKAKVSFDSHSAMNALGKADADALKAA